MTVRELAQSAFRAIQDAASATALEEIRVHYLGRKGEITQVLRSLGELPIEERRRVGPEAQAAKRDIESALAARVAQLPREDAPITLDLTRPGVKKAAGHIHPLAATERDIRRIFSAMNFSVVEGPEVETEHYNFDALNVPPHHPAREMQDTFWVSHRQPSGDRLLMRTHTSPVQVRYMERHTPPFQIIVPGRVFRYEATDASHEFNFSQVEGLMVGKEISLANFKFVVEEFLKKFFAGQRISFQYRASYFPFTEPSVEVDILFRGKWLEIMGAGMVHPNVFEAAHYNPHDWQGFAFGMSIERLAMIKHNIPDIRLFYSGDLRFIRQMRNK